MGGWWRGGGALTASCPPTLRSSSVSWMEVAVEYKPSLSTPWVVTLGKVLDFLDTRKVKVRKARPLSGFSPRHGGGECSAQLHSSAP